ARRFADLKPRRSNPWLVAREESLQLLQGRLRRIGYGAEFHSCLAPLQPLISLLGAGTGSAVLFVRRPDEDIHEMFAADIDQSGDRLAVHDVNAAALQRESLIAKILDRRREIQLTVEPGLHGVLIGRDNIGEMPGLQRSQVRVNNPRGKHAVIAATAAQGSNSPASIGSQKNRRCECEPTPDGARWEGSYGDLRTETGKDPFAKCAWRSLIELRQAHGRVQRLQVLECVYTLGAVFQMEFEFRGARGIQFVVEVAMHNSAGAVTDHG